jgi:hypothetical protein
LEKMQKFNLKEELRNPRDTLALSRLSEPASHEL